ncbi:MAG: hypothetical protein OK474_02300 [Thaumarchaeota archaeon]|nr:hypothetical protein [Nitrososphaerota archaeon]
MSPEEAVRYEMIALNAANLILGVLGVPLRPLEIIAGSGTL